MMQCPLCGGPLRLEEGVFLCERQHRLDGDQLRAAAATRVSSAFWMAIEALESEATALRSLATLTSADGTSAALAEQAEEDARLLRQLAGAHLPSDFVAEDAGASD